MNICGKCDKEYEFKIHTNCTTKLCRVCYREFLTKQRKQIIVAFFGNKCQHCGYNLCLDNLVFCDITGGLTQINKLYRPTWKKYINELKECFLLCRNCQGELQNKLWAVNFTNNIDDSICEIIREYKR